MNDKKKLRVGVIGAGAIAHACHLPGYHKNPHTSLVAFADPSLDQHAEMREKYPEVQPYSDFYEMIEEANLDVVSVCTPNVHHAAAAIHAMHAGAHVLCEKPMALTLDEADHMIQVAEETGRKLMIGFTHRLYSGPALCLSLMQDHTLGRVFSMRVRFAHGGPFPGWARTDWFYKPVQAGGGALLDMGIHAIDLCQWLVGPIATVQARAATLVKDIQVDDNAALLIEFAGGALGMIEVGWTSGPGFSGFEIYGTEGSLICDYRRGVSLFQGETRPDGTQSGDWKVLLESAIDGGWEVEIDRWIDVVRDKAPLTMDGEAGRTALQVALAAYESSETGRRIEIV